MYRLLISNFLSTSCLNAAIPSLNFVSEFYYISLLLFSLSISYSYSVLSKLLVKFYCVLSILWIIKKAFLFSAFTSNILFSRKETRSIKSPQQSETHLGILRHYEGGRYFSSRCSRLGVKILAAFIPLSMIRKYELTQHTYKNQQSPQHFMSSHVLTPLFSTQLPWVPKHL